VVVAVILIVVAVIFVVKKKKGTKEQGRRDSISKREKPTDSADPESN
jgi:hypothetical protein